MVVDLPGNYGLMWEEKIMVKVVEWIIPGEVAILQFPETCKLCHKGIEGLPFVIERDKGFLRVCKECYLKSK